MKNIRKKVVIYTDGACSGNPGPGGYGIIMQYNGVSREFSDGFTRTTNNRMELLAAVTALQNLKEPCSVTIHSDSQYLINGMTKGWAESWQKNGWRLKSRKPAQNTDLWKKLLSLSKIHDIEFVWVKGHSENEFNNRCDVLAVAASKEPKNEDTKYLEQEGSTDE